MATPFKLKSGNVSSFKNLGSSPAKQKLPEHFNTTGGTTTTPGYSTTKAAKNINRPVWDRSGGIEVGDHHKVTKGLEAGKPPKKAIVTKTTQTGTKTNAGPSDRYSNKSARGKAKFIEQSGGRKVTKGGGHHSPKSVLDVANKSKGKAGKVFDLLTKGGKQLAKRLGPIGWGLTAIEVGSKAGEAIEGLKERTKKETETGYSNPGVSKI